MTEAFATELALCGPWRQPKQMLAEQSYDGHKSLHDDKTAERLGFRGGPIEGPTHFSQFDPLLYCLWGPDWFARGCISAHFQTMCVEGDEVRAFVGAQEGDSPFVRIWAEKRDGSTVLTGTASLGPDYGETELQARLEKLRPPGPLVILRDVQIGPLAGPETVRMDADTHMGDMYPFSLNDKLEKITERSTWYGMEGEATSPFSGPIIPFEMISVLSHAGSQSAGIPVRGPSIGLFADLEVRIVDGPLMVGQTYELEREIVALSDSRRTESYWLGTTIRDPDQGPIRAMVLLNLAVLKESYEPYEAELAALPKDQAGGNPETGKQD